MKFLLLATSLFSILIHHYCAGNINCGCLPGHHGEVGPRGYRGSKGERGDIGDPGLTGVPGDRGPQGPRGNAGAVGAPGRNAPFPGIPATFGPPGAPGRPGRCLCPVLAPVVAGGLFLTDEYGDPTYMGSNLRDEDIYNMFEDKMTTPPPLIFQPNKKQPYSGLYMMDPNGVLTPVTNVNPYELFAAANIQQTTTTTSTTTTTTTTTTTSTTTTTKPPFYTPNNNIYVLGPKGTLIPIDVLGYKDPIMQDYQHYTPNRRYHSNRDNLYSHSNRDKYFGEYRNKHNSTSSYSEWLRSIFLAEDYTSDFENDNLDHIETNEQVAEDNEDKETIINLSK